MICENTKRRNFMLSGTIFLSVFAAIIWFLISASIAEARLADDVVGQTDASGTISYTVKFPNNAVPNQRGMYTPFSIEMDTINHRLFVSDSSDNRILVFNLDVNNNLVDRVADYVIGQPNFTTGATSTGASGLNSPYGLALNVSSSLLFVADYSNNRVLVFEVSSITNGEEAVNVLGQTDFIGTSAAVGQNRLNRPYGLVLNSSSTMLYVSDYFNNRVLVFDVTEVTNGENAVNVLGQSSFDTSSSATTQNGLQNPRGMTFSSISNTLFVADTWNYRVLTYDVTEITNGENAVNVLGQSNFTSSASGVTQSTFNAPNWLEFDAASNTLYVADIFNYRVMVFDLSSISDGENAINVLGQSDFTSKLIRADQSAINLPGDIYLDGTNRLLYVSDYNNKRVGIFNVAQIIDNENQVNVLGQLDNNDSPVYTTQYINNTAPNAAGLYGPNNVAVDSVYHRLFVSELTNNRVLVYNLDDDNSMVDRVADYVLGQANFASTATATLSSGLNNPYGLVFDNANNRLFVADRINNRVMVFDTAAITNGENAVNVLGQANFTSSGSGLTSSTFNSPQDLAYDTANNRLFVSDRSNHRVLVFDASSTTDGEGAVNVLGQANFTSNTGQTTQAGLYAPVGLYYDGGNSRLIVGDRGNNRVVIFNVAEISDGENAVNVLGQANFTAGSAAMTQNGFDRPETLAYDSARGLLFVSDSANDRIMIFDINEVADGENAVNIIGQSDFTSRVYATNQSNFSFVSALNYGTGLDYDSTSRQLFVTDYTNNRLLIFNLITLSTSTFSDPKYGVSYTASALTSSNYQGTLSYAVSSGTLPSGITLATSTGILSGSPSVTGSFSFSITATETESTGDYSDSQNFSITIGHPTVQFSAGSSSDYERNSIPSTLITLSDSSAYDITITLSTPVGTAQGNGMDYSASSTITIPAGATTTRVPLRVMSDDTIESDETIEFTIATALNASLGAKTSHTFTITNDDIEGSMGTVYQGGSGSAGSGSSSGVGAITVIQVPASTSQTTAAPASLSTTNPVSPAATRNTSAAPYMFSRSLRYGSLGTDVRILQQKLKELGYFTYPSITGFYGPVTAKAVSVLQRAQRLASVGTVGPKTLELLNRLSVSQSFVTPPPSTAAASVTSRQPQLRQGNTGNDIRTLQTILKVKGFFNGPVTGYFGPLTRQAVLKLEKRYKLPLKGTMGAKEWGKVR